MNLPALCMAPDFDRCSAMLVFN